MNVLYFLLPISVVVLIVAIAGFFWAINSGQYDDLDRHAIDILLDDAEHNQTSNHDD
jgi:cbb3-type cytochrome oxidase maturation protein